MLSNGARSRNVIQPTDRPYLYSAAANEPGNLFEGQKRKTAIIFQSKTCERFFDVFLMWLFHFLQVTGSHSGMGTSDILSDNDLCFACE
ncbi:hypothetical protein CDAR_183291 [Caerostris darwini]|uniref:Uncharacterized protein n=1 Tax=Caerostris darwini TaxID=1538125 RepID=A0AAV4WME5_9ARAC|nr:hypothetical protein CDAR_183291 [Caerostris darwini]